MSKLLDCTPPFYETLIVGGGIVGAGLFRDLSLQGVKTLLIDKKDFASQTSSKSSKMLHGGIRYLENGDFHLVWEALHEKNLWLKLAPHLCREKSFVLPIYQDSVRPLWMLKAGLLIYDILSSFENKPHKILLKNELQKFLPDLKTEGLKGAGLYHDVYMDDIKLCLENIYDGQQNPDCRAVNYIGITKFEKKGQFFYCTLEDEIDKSTKEILCHQLVFATGPFTDLLLDKLIGKSWNHHLLPSQGSHLWIKKDVLNIDNPLVLTPADGRVIFVMPWDYSILVGTTEVRPSGEFFDIKPKAQEISYLLNNLNEYFPGKNINESHILSSFSGIRPLVKEGPEILGKAAREHKVFRPNHNMHVIIGGKYTTFRKMVQETAESICHFLGRSYNSHATIDILKRPSIFPAFEDNRKLLPETIEEIIHTESIRKWEDLLFRRIGVPDVHHWRHEIPLFNFFAPFIAKYTNELGPFPFEK